jgi:hypothetical protein
VVVIGDSFTRGFWQDYFAVHVGRYVWIHHELCGFAMSVVEAYEPAFVILAPVERQMFAGEADGPWVSRFRGSVATSGLADPVNA